LRSIVPVDHLDLVCGGRVVRSFVTHTPIDHAEFSGSIALEESGWCIARASSDAGRYPVLDTYVYATTSPVYVTIGRRRPRSPEDARYFAAWVDRIAETTSAYPDWNSAAEKRSVLARLEQAKAVFVGLDSSAAGNQAGEREPGAPIGVVRPTQWAQVKPGLSKARVRQLLGVPWRTMQYNDLDPPGDEIWEYRGRDANGTYRIHIEFDQHEVVRIVGKIPDNVSGGRGTPAQS
jgi:hypothetical protein